MKQTKSSINQLQRAAEQLSRLIWRVTAAGDWYQGTQVQTKPAPAKRVPVVVLARELYREQWQTFAIRSQRELAKILRLRDDSPEVMHFISAERDGQRQVLTLRLTQAGQTFATKGHVVLPESLVLSRALEQGFFHVRGTTHDYYLKNEHTEWRSALKSALLRDSATAKLALGVASEQAVQELSADEVQTLLPEGIRKLGFQQLQQGWRAQQRESAFPWRQTLLASAAVVVAYGVLSTGYLALERWLTEQQLAGIESEVTVLLDEQAAMRRAQQTITELQTYQTNWQAVNEFWQTYHLVEEKNVELSFLRGDFQAFVLSGTADGALAFLQDLHNSPAIDSADFDAPVRAVGNKQRFIITFDLASSEVAEAQQ